MTDIPIATICGSMKLFKDMLVVAEWLTRDNYIVLMPFVQKGASDMYNPKPISDTDLDAMHFEKIDMADVVVFVTKQKRFMWGDFSGSDEFYFGVSTRNEMEYCKLNAKKTMYVTTKLAMYKHRVVELSDEIGKDFL
jgi:hypothetical protein